MGLAARRRQVKWKKRTQSLLHKAAQLAEETDGQVALFLCDRSGKTEDYISKCPVWNARFRDVVVNVVAGPPTCWQRTSSSISDEDDTGESIVVDGSSTLALKPRLRSSLETIQEDSNVQDLGAPQLLELEDTSSDCAADADTSARAVESASSFPAAPADMPQAEQINESGLVAPHLVATIPSTPVETMDLSVPDSPKSQLWFPVLHTTDEPNIWGGGNLLAAPEGLPAPTNYDTMNTSMSDSGYTQPLSRLENSNTNIGIEGPGDKESLNEAGEALCTITGSLEGLEGADENRLHECEQEDVRQTTRLDRLEWVFVDEPKIDILQLFERWNWVFPKDEEHCPGSCDLGGWCIEG